MNYSLIKITQEFLQAKAIRRACDMHKGQAGRALLLTGSLTYPGASWLALSACLRSGVGYATISSPIELIPSLASTLPSAIYLPKQELKTVEEQSQFIALLKKQSAVLIGSGRGLSESSKNELRLCLQFADRLIIDADALSTLAIWQKEGLLTQLLKTRRLRKLKPIILLPHYGELKKLFCSLGTTTSQNLEKMWQAELKKTPFSFNTTDIERLVYGRIVQEAMTAQVLIKGAPTYLIEVDSVSSSIYLNTSGSNALAKAGSGDVLAGLLCGLIAQGIDYQLACQLAVYIHGLASDILEKGTAKRSILPSDLPYAFGKAFKLLNWD